MLLLLASLACSPEPADTGVAIVPWTAGLPRLGDKPAPRGGRWSRGIIHFHSPWSHDACDGDPLPGGEPNLDCLADFRAALCTTAMDYVFVTDHPTHAAYQDFESLLWLEEGDEAIDMDGDLVANRMACPDGTSTLLMPGLEDELMPVGMMRHSSDDEEERHALYNTYDAATVSALAETGAVVLVAHTEHRDVEMLASLQDDGLKGIEMFNLHAMVDPTKREEDLGLEAMGWVDDIAPFTDPAGTAEPDLMFLAFYQEQTTSIATWDNLSARASTVGVAGTDAHQNVMPLDLRDGERLDSYRRMARWFSNWLLVGDDSSTSYREALALGRNTVVFEALGTPRGFDFVLVTENGAVMEAGAEANAGTLYVECPSLDPESPQGLEAPEIRVRVIKDGLNWAEDCGAHELTEPGVYRVVVDITPYHLSEFLGDDPSPWMHPTPWIYSNAIRLTGESG